MNFLTEKASVRAWAIAFLQPNDGKTLAFGDMLDQYERDVRIRLTDGERKRIRQYLGEICIEIWGVEPPLQARADAAVDVLSGVSFRPPEKIAGKPVLWVKSKTIINFNSGFNEKDQLSTAGAANYGIACVSSCSYCSSPNVMERNPQTRILRLLGLDHRDVIIRRLNAGETARQQLTYLDGKPRFTDPTDNRIIEIASLVEALATPAMTDETEQLVRMIFELTPFRVRILTKSALLSEFARRFDGLDRGRLLLGFSTGIPWDDVAKDVEKGTTLPSTRFRIHQELLNEGFNMFGMLCPLLAVGDYRKMADELVAKIQPERLEKIWVEVINRRGDSLIRTIARLRQGGHRDLANQLARVSSSQIRWELEYNREAFLAFREVISADRLAYLTYTTPDSELWWSGYAGKGAVLL